MKTPIKCIVLILLITTLLILAGCGESKVDTVSSSQQDHASFPQVNADAFKGQGRIAFVWNGLLYVLDGEQGTLTKLSDAGQARWPKWSPDGQWLAYIRYGDEQMNSGVLFIVKPDGGQSYEVNDLPQPADSKGITWLPASEALVVSPGGYVSAEEQGLYMVRPGETPRKVSDHTGSLSPDGRTIACVNTLPSSNEQYPGMRNDALYVVPIEGGEPVQLHVAKEAGIHMAGWWPDGKGLLFRIAMHHSASILSDGTELYSVPLTGGEPRLLANSIKHPEWLSWSPDGSKLLSVKGRGREIWRDKSLVLCDIKTGESMDLPQRADTVSLDPAWSPDGKHIAYVEAVRKDDLSDAEEVVSWEQTRTLWVADADGNNSRQINEAGPGIKGPLWSRDGSHIMYLQDNAIWLVPVNGGSPVKIAGPLPDAPNPPGFYGYVSSSDILAFYGK